MTSPPHVVLDHMLRHLLAVLPSQLVSRQDGCEVACQELAPRSLAHAHVVVVDHHRSKVGVLIEGSSLRRGWGDCLWGGIQWQTGGTEQLLCRAFTN